MTEVQESIFTQLLVATILGDFDEFDRIERDRAAQAGASVDPGNWNSASASERGNSC